jgi:3',5'-cyclic AMP phosphodiesterase CpdA
VGFNGPPDPLGTKAFERAVEIVNKLPQRPDLVLFTGDLTHDSEDKDVHAQRMKQFMEISRRMNVPMIKYVPGEHDAGLDGGGLYRDIFGESYYSFDHRGVHFIGLDNVSQPKPEVGTKQLDWLKKDLSRFHKSTPHRGFHPSPFVRPAPRLGMVHQRRRQCHERPRALRQRHRTLWPHPSR